MIKRINNHGYSLINEGATNTASVSEKLGTMRSAVIFNSLTALSPGRNAFGIEE